MTGGSVVTSTEYGPALRRGPANAGTTSRVTASAAAGAANQRIFISSSRLRAGIAAGGRELSGRNQNHLANGPARGRAGRRGSAGQEEDVLIPELQTASNSGRER